VDVLVIDTAHGHSEGVLQAVARTREAFPDVQLIAGNVASRLPRSRSVTSSSNWRSK
jgi:IMP dehydrogenase